MADHDELSNLMSFLDLSPSPYHAVAAAAARLEDAGFERVAEGDDWTDARRAYAVRGGALVAWAQPDTSSPLPRVPFRIVGAHTDSPGLRVKPRPDTGSGAWRQLAVEVYGGPLLNSWLDRDLGVAGRVLTKSGDEFLVDLREPLARVPQLAIHLDRDVNDRGLLLDKQQHLTPVWGVGVLRTGDFVEYLAQRSGMVAADQLTAWELCLYDLTPAAVLGGDASLLASGRLDNLVSCWAATRALCASAPADEVRVVALFDHEEVGSESTSGAAGPLLEHVLERLALARGATRDDFLRSLTASSCISADNAHAVHPNYPERHEPGHRPMVNAGPALKVNANQRYATSATTSVLFEDCCRRADVPLQSFVSRNNMPCGSTIGPITATRLGIPTVDVGVPQLSMHSARELCGVDDPGYLVRALTAYFSR
jgi:aspartyl aminopeptidase